MDSNLEKRVQELEDVLAIQNLKHVYLNACDSKDVPLMISTFVKANCFIDYGPVGTFDGGREKAPAALCRKIINAKNKNLKKIDLQGVKHSPTFNRTMKERLPDVELLIDPPCDCME